MSELSTKIKEYAKVNGITNLDFTKDVILQDNLDGKGAFIASWNLNIAKPSMEQLNAFEAQANIIEINEQVIADRKKAYGTIEQQIEFITENGIEAWQQKVQQIKTENPKN